MVVPVDDAIQPVYVVNQTFDHNKFQGKEEVIQEGKNSHVKGNLIGGFWGDFTFRRGVV